MTQSDLYQGLMQIGNNYGKDNPRVVKRPKTSKLNATQRESKMITYT